MGRRRALLEALFKRQRRSGAVAAFPKHTAQRMGWRAHLGGAACRLLLLRQRSKRMVLQSHCSLRGSRGSTQVLVVEEGACIGMEQM